MQSLYPEVTRSEQQDVKEQPMREQPGRSAEDVGVEFKDDDDDSFVQPFVALQENTYGAALFAFIFVRKVDVCIYTAVPLALSWFVQIGFISYLSSAYMDEPKLSKETLEDTDTVPQLISIGYFIVTMLSNLEWLFISGYISLFCKKYQKDGRVFDLETRSEIKLGLGSTSEGGRGQGIFFYRILGFLLCCVAELVVWTAVLLVGVQYIMWSATQGDSSTKRAAAVLWAALSFTFITLIDEKLFAQVMPAAFKNKMKAVEFQVKEFKVSELGDGKLSPQAVAPTSLHLTKAFQFLLPTICLVGAAVASVLAVREGAIIEWDLGLQS